MRYYAVYGHDTELNAKLNNHRSNSKIDTFSSAAMHA